MAQAVDVDKGLSPSHSQFYSEGSMGWNESRGLAPTFQSALCLGKGAWLRNHSGVHKPDTRLNIPQKVLPLTLGGITNALSSRCPGAPLPERQPRAQLLSHRLERWGFRACTPRRRLTLPPSTSLQFTPFPSQDPTSQRAPLRIPPKPPGTFMQEKPGQ